MGWTEASTRSCPYGRMTLQPTRLSPHSCDRRLVPKITLSDTIAAVRRKICHHQISCMSRSHADVIRIPRQLWNRAANALAFAV